VVARIVDRRDDAHLQRAQERFFGAAFEPADALVDESKQVGDAVWHRRIGSDRALFRLAAHQRAVAAAEGALGLRQDIAQHVELFRYRRAAAEDHFGEFLEPHQPEGQVKRIGIDGNGVFGEGGGKFVVRIEDQHAQLRIGLDRLVQKQRDGSRFADTGRADHGEMLRQHRGHMDRRFDAFILCQVADDGGGALAGIIDAHQVRGADTMGDGAEMGITRNAGREFLAAVFVDADFAEQFRLDAEDIVLAFAPALVAGIHGEDEGDDTIPADADRNQPTDGP